MPLEVRYAVHRITCGDVARQRQPAEDVGDRAQRLVRMGVYETQDNGLLAGDQQEAWLGFRLPTQDA